MPIKELEKNITLLRDINEIYVLKLIKEEGPISRAEVSRRYNISRAAVSDIVNRLLQRDFVQEVGQGKSTGRGGRRPVLLKFNEKSGYVVGVELRKSSYRVGLCDLQANILAIYKEPFPESRSGQVLLRSVFQTIDQILAQTNVPGKKVLGIGIGLPGLVDFEQGILREAHSNHPWSGLPLKQLFEERYQTHIFVENDIKLSTIGEYVFGLKKSVSNMIFIGVGEGIGAGFIINGQIYRGITFSAGEIGYDELGYFLHRKDEFPLLFNGQRYFGDILSSVNLMRSFERAINNGRKSVLSDRNADVKTGLNPIDLVTAARDGDELCRDLMSEYAQLLGVLSVNLINYLNPEVVVFNGEIFETNGLVLKLIKDRVQRDILHLPAARVRVLSSATRRNSGLVGAAGLVLQELFEPPLIDTRRYRATFYK